MKAESKRGIPFDHGEHMICEAPDDGFRDEAILTNPERLGWWLKAESTETAGAL